MPKVFKTPVLKISHVPNLEAENAKCESLSKENAPSLKRKLADIADPAKPLALPASQVSAVSSIGEGNLKENKDPRGNETPPQVSKMTIKTKNSKGTATKKASPTPKVSCKTPPNGFHLYAKGRQGTQSELRVAFKGLSDEERKPYLDQARANKMEFGKQQRAKKKEGLQQLLKNVPKPENAFRLFYADVKEKVKNEGVVGIQITKRVGELWQQLGTESSEKKEYEARALTAKHEYDVAVNEIKLKNGVVPPRPISAFVRFSNEVRPKVVDEGFTGMCGCQKRIAELWQSQDALFVALKQKCQTDASSELEEWSNTYLPPKRPLSAYSQFQIEEAARIKTELADVELTTSLSETSKLIASRWKSVSPEVRQELVNQADAAKVKYNEAMVKYMAAHPVVDVVEPPSKQQKLVEEPTIQEMSFFWFAFDIRETDGVESFKGIDGAQRIAQLWGELSEPDRQKYMKLAEKAAQIRLQVLRLHQNTQKESSQECEESDNESCGSDEIDLDES